MSFDPMLFHRKLEPIWEHISWMRNPRNYTEIRESRHEIVFPFVRDLLRRNNVTSVLDYGCGDGTFVTETLSGLEITAVCYDSSSVMIASAKEKIKSHPNFSATTDRKDLDGRLFDAVTLVAVWMTWQTEADCISGLADIARRLSDDGCLIAAVTHPCFRETSFLNFRTDFSNRDYLQPGTKFHVYLADRDDQGVVLHDTHWNFQAMSMQLHSAGLFIDDIYELPDVERPTQGSPWVVLVARKRHRN